MKKANPVIISLALSALCIALVVSVSCNKGNALRPPLRTSVPVIDSIRPESGPFGTEVTVYGKNLGDIQTKITVNGKTAANKTPSDTKFVITVADTGSTGPIAVTTKLGSKTGPVFTYIPTSSYNTTVFAGDGTADYADGTGTKAKFNSPGGLAIDAAGNLYVADNKSNRIRKITTPGAVVTTIAGSGTAGSVNSTTPTAAQFNGPAGVTLDAQGNIYIADEFNNSIRKIATNGAVTTYTGSTYGSANGSLSTATFARPVWIITDKSGNFYVSEAGMSRIRQINNTSMLVSSFSGTGMSIGGTDGSVGVAQYNEPRGLALDAAGTNLYVCDFFNNKVRKVTVPAAISSFVAGSGTASFADGIGAAASFSAPCGLTADPDGNLYIADFINNRIRKLVISTGKVTTIAGNSTTLLVDGVDTKASFKNPYAIVRDATGNFYVTDLSNNVIRKMTPFVH